MTQIELIFSETCKLESVLRGNIPETTQNIQNFFEAPKRAE